MIFKNSKADESNNILANDHFVAINYDCSALSPDENGVVKAGTIVDDVGVLLNEVNINKNPNGAVVIHGFIDRDKLPTPPSNENAFPQITFLPVKTGA